MGTNYYLYEADDCPTCGRGEPPLHIGKSSYGWRFSLHIDDEIKSLDAWRRRWSAPSVHIKNEYGDRVSVEEMERIILNRSHPSGLAFHDIDGWPYVGHGDGTYDLIRGEFL